MEEREKKLWELQIKVFTIFYLPSNMKKEILR